MKTMKCLFLAAFAMLVTEIHAQQNNHYTMTNQEIVQQFLEGFNDPTKIQASLDLLAEDYRFSNPMVQLDSKAAFIQLAQEIAGVLTGLEIHHIAQAGDWVAASYTFKSALPGLENNEASEWFRLKNGTIQESRLIYDATNWRKVYEQMEK